MDLKKLDLTYGDLNPFTQPLADPEAPIEIIPVGKWTKYNGWWIYVTDVNTRLGDDAYVTIVTVPSISWIHDPIAKRLMDLKLGEALAWGTVLPKTGIVIDVLMYEGDIDVVVAVKALEQ